ncbi:MAG TPA: hypothetical protein VIH57_21885 [Bacteroidales bacterium]
MKTLQTLLITSLMFSSFYFTGCSEEKDQAVDLVNKVNLDTLSFSHSMKGWELYSWPNGNSYNYSILMGTNRVKSYEEVTTNKIIVSGKDSLKMVLDKFPQKENLFWIGKGWLEKCWHSSYGNLSLPDMNTINEIKEYCNQKNLILNVSE